MKVAAPFVCVLISLVTGYLFAVLMFHDACIKDQRENATCRAAEHKIWGTPR